MAEMGVTERKNLMKELEHGRDFTRQLQVHLNASSSSKEVREFLVQKILSSYETSLSLLSCSTTMADHPQFPNVGIKLSDSPSPNFNESPRSEEDSDFEFKDPPNHKNGSKKRNHLQTWSRKVRVSPGLGVEGPLGDDFTWRKYGQKDILGANYPRSYYRCSYRNLKGCLAAKQVQRSDEDPSIFEITYLGTHTCNQTSNSPILPFCFPPANEDSTPSFNQPPQNQLLESLKIVGDEATAQKSIQFASSSYGIAEDRSEAKFSTDFSILFGAPEKNSCSGFHDDSELSKVVSPATSSSGSRTMAIESSSMDPSKLDSSFRIDNSGFFSTKFKFYK